MKGPRLVFGVLEHRVVKFRGPTSVVGERNQLVASTKCFLCKYPNDGGDQGATNCHGCAYGIRGVDNKSSKGQLI